MQGERAEKRGRWGRSWWGKRPLNYTPVSCKAGTNKFYKRLLHKIERRINKKEIENDLSKG